MDKGKDFSFLKLLSGSWTKRRILVFRVDLGVCLNNFQIIFNEGHLRLRLTIVNSY